jgi:hypothetical protein
MALMDQKSGASPHAHNVLGPLRKAINAGRIAAESKADDDEVSNRRQHLKMKFKVDERHTAMPDAASHSSASLHNTHSGGFDHRSSPFGSRYVSMSNVKMSNVKMSNVKMSNVKMSNVKMSNVKMSNVKMSIVKMSIVKMLKVKMLKVRMFKVKMLKVRMSKCRKNT